MLSLLVLLTSLQSSAASANGLVVQAVRLAEGPPGTPSPRLPGLSPIVLDGRLDEAAWAQAPPATGFKQREPQEGAPATDDTEVRLLFDAKSLYVGIVASTAICIPVSEHSVYLN